jgi:DinB superfamily
MRPKPGDYNLYYDRYISLIEEDDIINVIEKQKKSSETFLKSFTEENGIFAYAEGKWTVKEVLGHLIDTERIMAYRALAFARGEKQSLPGFEQDDYVAESNFNKRSLDHLIIEFITVRESNIILFQSFDEKILIKRGTASGSEITVLALIYIIAGHEKHHMKFLRERYTIK